MTCGIYEIVSPSGKRYIGSSRNIERRWREHRRQLRGEVHHSLKLTRAANRYTVEALQHRVLLVCRVEDLLMYEQLAIDSMRPEYNTRPMASGSNHPPEVLAKIAAASRGRRHTPETLARMSSAQTGRSFSDETRAKMSASRRRRVTTDETRAKMSTSWTLERRAAKREIMRSYEAFGRPWTLNELAEAKGVSSALIAYRLARGWDIERAATTPPRKWVRSKT